MSSANVFCVEVTAKSSCVSFIFMPTYYISTWRIGFHLFGEISTKLVSKALWLMFGNQLLRFENIFFFKLGILCMFKFICREFKAFNSLDKFRQTRSAKFNFITLLCFTKIGNPLFMENDENER